MNRIEELNAIVAQYDLNNHPFYQEWRMGTLPTQKLADYAGEYGRFVGTIAHGWETVGRMKFAQEEREHEMLWADFKDEVGCSQLSNRPQTDVLVTAATKMFMLRPEATGALYAFEAQQPYTSRSKLDGLNEHYSLSDKGKEYFVVHASDFAEVEDLKVIVNDMTEEEFARAKASCAVVCSSMWSALDGVYYN